MVKVNRPLVGAFAIFIFLLTCFTGWFSFNSYLDFLQLNDTIVFSWKVGLMVFGSPLLFYFSYLFFYSAINNEVAKINNKLGGGLFIIMIAGAIISLFSSFYISYNFRSYGYELCPKNSWMAPNKYVKKITLCDEW
ncbi:DUF1240 domain-containing protein [Pectobacterium parmentieri]|uniref:DUF1240 domain-containing protein n=1 Tax=Pectobacterium parmentieri TaxID=1905730 RepID=UPI000CDD7D38|nr:DUF1240 domain-containing protein [Pectobacterium parmentieri]AYH08181.1 DUF1240 domain-containing protein [Pectobacterium parmentieri]AYH16933.1 DUF1240 domain-containing protein [Pectobacterium parmentieri]AYH25638.1 DUF1240 domain-containing protein [Pectobacterium parmentieri]MBN3176217.1 DUF1240 domain-containing protein [Pectobacterium parmentieri]POW28853.1 membrane protein [Pectobacterium parmentieri]